MRSGLALRWSVRDLRRRWVQVTAIAVVIGIGTGVYSGLGSTAAWRQESNDASFELLGMYDLRVTVPAGVDAPAGAMAAVLDRLPDPDVVATAEERLIAPTQVDASVPGQAILVPGRIVGADVAGGGPEVNRLWVGDGRGRSLRGDDDGTPTVVLERKFAEYYDLPVHGAVRLAGGHDVRYVGLGLSPEYFFVTTEESAVFAEANFAVVFAPLTTAQALAGRPGRVNDLVIRLRPGVDPSTLVDDVTSAFQGEGLAVTVMQRKDEDAYRVLYDDIDSDQKFWNVFAALILAGAAFGAFNLSTRMVESQRREIGIGMALGATPATLAVRPILVGAEIAALGVVAGFAMGMAVTGAIRPVFTSMLPLPVWRTDFQPDVFVRGALLGLLLPVVATVWPVWRAVRVTPVEAIATTHRTARGGLAPLLRHLRWPAGAFARMPIGNILRAPRRTLLTALGIGAAVTAVLATLGMIDSFLGTLDRSDREMLGSHADRVTVALRRPVEVDAAALAAVDADPSVALTQPVLRLGGRLSSPGTPEPVDVLVEVRDLESHVWAPTIVQGRAGRGTEGVVISAEAAHDLGVGAGDTVVLEHPALGTSGLETRRTPLRVAGVHPSPFRFTTFLDRSQLSLFGLGEVANQVDVIPAPGHTPQEVQRAVFAMDGVASAQPVTAVSDVVHDALDEFVGVFRVLVGFVLLLALLIAYNAALINFDERVREHSTLFAFGLPVRRVALMDVFESGLVGLLGTAMGVVGGVALLGWITSSLVGRTVPELGIDVVVSTGTVVTAVVLGVLAVAAAPLLTVRRLRRMDLPGTLRVVE